MKIIYRAADIIEAHIVSGMLMARGIEAYVGGHYLQGGIGELSPLGFATVSVAGDDVEAATSMIREYEHGDNTTAEGFTTDGGPTGQEA